MSCEIDGGWFSLLGLGRGMAWIMEMRARSRRRGERSILVGRLWAGLGARLVDSNVVEL